jgi:hypothetical protein
MQAGPNELRLPDFIIGGAPKCATSSLHFILAQHEEIGIPDPELHFFDADDPVTHPDFFRIDRRRLVAPDNDATDGPLFRRYSEHFRPFQDARFIGEDSTTYLMSEVAAARIKRMLPDAKLVFMLRDPVARAWSQYWHLVRSGRAAVSFERALSAHPAIVLGSTYARSLSRYFELFGRDRVKVALFEDLTGDTRSTVDSVTDFIGAQRFGAGLIDTWFNRTAYPLVPNMELLLNRVRRHLVKGRYRRHLGGSGGRLGMLADRAVQSLVPTTTRAPRMAESTRAYLTRHLSQRNLGLSKLLDRDLSEVWKGFTG